MATTVTAARRDRLPGERHHLLQRPSDQQRRPRQRGHQHPLVRTGLGFEEQVRLGARGREQRGHQQDRRDEPLPDVAAEHPGLSAERADQQRPEQGEEDQRLQQTEDHRERVAAERAQLAGHHDAGVAHEPRAGRHRRGGSGERRACAAGPRRAPRPCGSGARAGRDRRAVHPPGAERPADSDRRSRPGSPVRRRPAGCARLRCPARRSRPGGAPVPVRRPRRGPRRSRCPRSARAAW